VPAPVDAGRLALRLADDISWIARSVSELPRVVGRLSQMGEDMRRLRDKLAPMPGQLEGLLPFASRS
jgi:hypothetical protein